VLIPIQKCKEIKKTGCILYVSVCVCVCMRDYHARICYVCVTWSTVPQYDIRKWIKKFLEFNCTTHLEVMCTVAGHRWCKCGHEFVPVNSEFWRMSFGRKGHRSGGTIGSWIMTMYRVMPPLQCSGFWCRNKFKLFPSHRILQISLHVNSGTSQDLRMGWQVIIFLWSNKSNRRQQQILQSRLYW
jgi:hypothetical protein